MTDRWLELLRRLLLVTAAVCLLGTGGVDLLRAPAEGAAPAVGTGTGAKPVPPAALSPLRVALAAATPLLGGDLAPPGAGPILPLHAAAASTLPPAVRRAPWVTVDGVDGRGPPRTAGT